MDRRRTEIDAPRPRRRRRRRRRRHQGGSATWLLLLAAILAALAWRLLSPERAYRARDFGVETAVCALDADGDGVDDYRDILLGAREYIKTHPHYKSAYYAGGYPDDGCGVCTDVIWQALRAAGYELKDLVDADIAAHPSCYPNISTPDPNIDFRRVNNLNSYLSRHADSLTCDTDDPAQWQAGDIVIFGESEHIAICSDKRNDDGIPWIIHHGNPVEEAVERNQIGNMPITAHYRWNGNNV
jgi:uncharacterized protein YijF (DUF1287 family)